jgi:hypothetical protein
MRNVGKSTSMTVGLRRTVLFTCVHAVLTLGLMSYSIWEMSRYEGHFETPHASLGPVAQLAVDCLMFPGRMVWTSWASKNLPNILEWGLVLGNSTLWGSVLSAIVGRLFRRRARHKARTRMTGSQTF